MDQHGNVEAREGVDRCHCGVKYWENDHCIDCGAHVSESVNKPVEYDCQSEFGPHEHANEAEVLECQRIIDLMSAPHPDADAGWDAEYQNYMFGSSRF